MIRTRWQIQWLGAGMSALMLLPTALSAQAFEVTFESTSGLIYVDASVNGQGPFRFMLDLGASGIGRIDRRLVTRLALPRVGSAPNSDGVNTRTVAVVAVASLAFGPITVTDVQLRSRDYNRSAERPMVMGILGQQFFRDYLLTIDYPRRQIRLARGHLEPDDPFVTPYESTFRVAMTIGSIRAAGEIDTGSTLVMHLPRRYADSVRTSPLEAVGRGRRANTTFELYGGTLFEPLVIAGSSHDSLRVGFSDLVEDINIGAGFLSRFVVRVDQHRKLIQLVPVEQLRPNRR